MADEIIRTKVGALVDYAAISDGARGTPDLMIEALSHLTRDDALFHCARANTIATGFDLGLSPVERQRRLVATYCSPEQTASINAFAQRHGGVGNVSVFFQGQILELARWVAKNCRHDPQDGSTFENPNARSAFVRAALIASDLWNSRVFGNRFTDIDSVDDPIARVMGSFRKGMEESGQAEHSGIAMARGWLLFSRYLPKRWNEFPALFEETTGLSIERYFTCAVAFILYIFPSSNTGPLFRTEHVADATAVRETFAKFIRLRGQTPEELASSISDKFDPAYKNLRSRPIINFGKGRSAILDPIFYTDGISIAPVFDLLPVRKASYVLGKFGEAFEDYALDFLREMFPTIPGLEPRLTTNVKRTIGGITDFECDAIVNDVLTAFVFEIKAAWIREDAILTEDHEDFVEQLRKKYGASYSTSDDRQERKGVAQLARSIGAIARREWLGQHNSFSQVGIIYPVLLVHDQRVSYPGTATFLNQEFRRALGQTPRGLYVHNLIVLTVSDVENLASSVENFAFSDFIKDYSSHFPERNVSVHNFMAMSKRYSGLVKPSQKLRDTTDAMMSAIKRELFPQVSQPEDTTK